MKKLIKILSIVNILFYICCFTYTYIASRIEIVNWWSVIIFAIYILLFISLGITFHYEFKGKTKLWLIVDFIIRVAAAFISFYIVTINEYSFKLVMIGILILLFIINIILEVFIYKYINYEGKKLKWEEVSWEDRKSHNSRVKSISNIATENIILGLVTISLYSFDMNFSMGYILGFCAINILLLSHYFKCNYYSINLYYSNKSEAKKMFIKENLFVVISLVVGVVFIFIREKIKTDEMKFISLVLQVAPLYLPLQYRYKRAIRTNEIIKSKR